jgi:DNA replication protein DnaC
MQSLRDVINGMGGNSRETFQQRLARFQEKHREREPEYDPTPTISRRPVKKQYQCNHCKCTVDEETQGWMKDESGKAVPCPVCSPAVRAVNARRFIDRLIKYLVDNFKFSDMQNLPDESAKLSLQAFPKQGDKIAKRLIEQFISRRIKELILIGEPGLGKTGLAISAVKELTEQGIQAVFLPMSYYVDLCREDMDFNNKDKSRIVEIANRVETLVLDDVGLEVTTKKTVEITQKLIEARHSAGLSTLITSNMDLPGLLECWSLPEYERTRFQPAKRTIDRLENWYKVHTLQGVSLRKGA